MKPGRETVKLTRICGETAEALGYELVEVELDRQNASLYLRVYLDQPGGISLQDCERYHKMVQPRLEDFEYDFLEVSSPGIDRPIRNRRDFMRAKDTQVEIRLYRPLEGQKIFTGILTELNDEGYHLQTEGGLRVFPVKDVALAKRYIDVDRILRMENHPGRRDNERPET